METGSVQKTVDVVIPVYRPKEDFIKLLWMLKKQTVEPGKIILMITESEGTKYPDFSGFEPIEIHTLKPESFDHGNTRNEGIACSDADYVLLLTQDAEPADTHFIETLMQGFEQDHVAVTYARQLPRKEALLSEKLVREFNYPPASCYKDVTMMKELGIKTFFCSDVAALYDRKIFNELGGFLKKTIFNEDMIFAHRAIECGYAVYYNADAKVYHSHHYTGKEQFRRNFDIGVSQADHPEVFENVSSEKEGSHLVKHVVKELFRHGKPFEVFSFGYQCVMKYLGFRMGKSYRKLSMKRIRRYTMNPYYWEKNDGED